MTMYGQRSFEYSVAQEWNTVSYLKCFIICICAANASLYVDRSVVLHNIKDHNGKKLLNFVLSLIKKVDAFDFFCQIKTQTQLLYTPYLHNRSQNQSEPMLLSLTK